jgi:ankyrin repeat domain-containing protein 50
MDGLSAVASVIAVIQVTQSVGVLLRDLYRDIRDARAEIERLYDSVVSLEIIARGLDDLVKQRGIVMMNSALLEDPKGPLKQALSELQRVKEKLEVQTIDDRFEKLKLSVKQSIKRSLKWPFKKEEVLTIVARMENQKSSLILDIDVNTLYVIF